jgi:RING-box protein 2
MAEEGDMLDRGDAESQKSDKMFTLKKWNAVAMWSWDVECDTCAICRVQVMGKSHGGFVYVKLMVRWF